ncbi:DedA family protein [Luteipulveratus sp. YIM 133132]|uniref:DedA family protein n=1 Tax=Luteipulveratus flavus TaxID=3031728 RepID=A0ABT6C2Q4_9MICO|nr:MULTISPECIES: DedA family protein [unclassified Luteipulveratus]MDE9367132.1 DedA family protein [Luteipulveratus sp. YIM 133132]MDF8263122.1 DedA family protein [Luteipulveratus sp. YIM 133296]
MNVDHWLLTIPPVAVYLLAGAVVGLESLGIPLPGEIVLVAAAVLSSRHELAVSPHGVAIAGVLGAVIGDSIGYVVGRRYGDRLFGVLGRRFPDHVNDDVLAYARHVFSRYGMAAVFFGRFVALLRIFAGPLSGSMRMHYPRFLLANVTGAIAWAAGTTYLVYYLGTAAESWLKGFSFVGLGIALAFGITLSTLLRRHLQDNVRAYAEQRRSQEAA